MILILLLIMLIILTQTGTLTSLSPLLSYFLLMALTGYNLYTTSLGSSTTSIDHGVLFNVHTSGCGTSVVRGPTGHELCLFLVVYINQPAAS